MTEWIIVVEDLPTYIGLEDGLSVLISEDSANNLVWGDVWDEV